LNASPGARISRAISIYPPATTHLSSPALPPTLSGGSLILNFKQRATAGLPQRMKKK
jgi:hypothetical protein